MSCLKTIPYTPEGLNYVDELLDAGWIVVSSTLRDVTLLSPNQ